jgi:hypothetical protein
MRFLVIGTWTPSDPDIPKLLTQEQQRAGPHGQSLLWFG